jgi:[ribosomal protein S5]-alanine N-acetyltransferase
MSDAFDPTAPEITTTRLNLRGLTTDDAQAIFRYASDPEVARFTLWPPHKSEEFTKGFLRLFTQPTFLSWAILPQDEEAVVGMVFLHSLNKQHKKAELAFNLARTHWKKGFVTEAAGAVLDFAFRHLALNRIEATCMPANVGARRVLEKLGLSREGRMRQSHFRYDGSHDMDLFAVLKDERRG